jgi:hypothetical protein
MTESTTPRLNYLLTCVNAPREPHTGLVSHLDVFTALSAQKNTLTGIPQMTFTVAGMIEDMPAGTVSVVVEIVSPDQQVIGRLNVSNEIPAGGRLAVTARFRDLIAPHEGTYYYRVIAEHVTLGDPSLHYFEVKHG